MPRWETGPLASLFIFQPPRNAPLPLAASLTHEALAQFLQTDLSEFQKLPRQQEEEEEEEDEEEEQEKAAVTCKFYFLSGDPTEGCLEGHRRSWQQSTEPPQGMQVLWRRGGLQSHRQTPSH